MVQRKYGTTSEDKKSLGTKWRISATEKSCFRNEYFTQISISYSNLVTITKDVETRTNKLKEEIPPLQDIVFMQGEILSNDIEREFGSICIDKDKPREHVEVARLLVSKKMDTQLQNLSVLCPFRENLIWEGSYEENKLQLLSLEDTSKPINELTLTFSACSISRNEQLILSDYANKLIISVSIDGTIKHLKDVFPLSPYCVHVTKNDEIIFGAVDQNRYEVDSKSIRLVMKMTMTGEIVNEYQFNERSIRLFTIPMRCFVNPINDDILVDASGVYSGSVVCCTNDGCQRFRYVGEWEKTSDIFHPVSLICTSEGNIIVSDLYNSLHILNPTGQLVKYICTTDKDIRNPYSLALNKDGQLLKGTFNRSYRRENSKLFICTIEDFSL